MGKNEEKNIYIYIHTHIYMSSQVVLVVKNPPTNVGHPDSNLGVRKILQRRKW